jgi:DNA-directed RNA polymerase subunit RPC12/RpoP
LTAGRQSGRGFVVGLTNLNAAAAPQGTRPAVTAVHCLHCGARYETDLPLSAVLRIRRCSHCGHAALEPVVEEPAHPEPPPAA